MVRPALWVETVLVAFRYGFCICCVGDLISLSIMVILLQNLDFMLSSVYCRLCPCSV